MIHLSKRFFYAAEAVLYIAYNGGADPVSSKEIAARQGMPPRYLEQMMQTLVREKILRGVRGPHGGYLLAMEKRRITLAAIYKALGEEEQIPPSTALGNQIIMPVLHTVQAALLKNLQETTLADLYEAASNAHIAKSSGESADFAI